jgi:hypothetical protein
MLSVYWYCLSTRRGRWMPFRTPFATAGEQFVENTISSTIILITRLFQRFVLNPAFVPLANFFGRGHPRRIGHIQRYHAVGGANGTIITMVVMFVDCCVGGRVFCSRQNPYRGKAVNHHFYFDYITSFIQDFFIHLSPLPSNGSGQTPTSTSREGSYFFGWGKAHYRCRGWGPLSARKEDAKRFNTAPKMIICETNKGGLGWSQRRFDQVSWTCLMQLFNLNQICSKCGYQSPSVLGSGPRCLVIWQGYRICWMTHISKLKTIQGNQWAPELLSRPGKDTAV